MFLKAAATKEVKAIFILKILHFHHPWTFQNAVIVPSLKYGPMINVANMTIITMIRD